MANFPIIGPAGGHILVFAITNGRVEWGKHGRGSLRFPAASSIPRRTSGSSTRPAGNLRQAHRPPDLRPRRLTRHPAYVPGRCPTVLVRASELSGDSGRASFLGAGDPGNRNLAAGSEETSAESPLELPPPRRAGYRISGHLRRGRLRPVRVRPRASTAGFPEPLPPPAVGDNRQSRGVPTERVAPTRDVALVARRFERAKMEMDSESTRLPDAIPDVQICVGQGPVCCGFLYGFAYVLPDANPLRATAQLNTTSAQETEP